MLTEIENGLKKRVIIFKSLLETSNGAADIPFGHQTSSIIDVSLGTFGVLFFDDFRVPYGVIVIALLKKCFIKRFCDPLSKTYQVIDEAQIDGRVYGYH